MGARTMLATATRKYPSTVSIRLIWLFDLVSQRLTGTSSGLRKQLGLRADQFADQDTRVPLSVALQHLDRLLDRAPMPSIGLVAAQLATVEHLGISEYLARTRPTLGQALATTAQYMRLLSDGVYQQTETRNGCVSTRFWFDSDLVLREEACEFVVAMHLALARRWMAMPDFAPLEVHFARTRPIDVRPYRDFFKCKLIFGAPATQMAIAEDMWSTKLSSADSSLGYFLECQAKAMLASLPHSTDLSSVIENMLNKEERLAGVTATHVARRLGVSFRTLSRRLEREGTSFRELLSDTKKAVALRDLTKTLKPIREISEQLGFTTAQSFHRAFRRWTGTSAARYRAENTEHRRSFRAFGSSSRAG